MKLRDHRDGGAGNAAADDKVQPTGDKGSQPAGEPTVEDLLKQRDELVKERDHLKGKLGSQSAQVGILRKIRDGFRSDPQGTIQTLAEEFGFTPPGKTAGGNDDSAGAGANDDAVSLAEKRIFGKIQPFIDSQHEQVLTAKYPNFGETAEMRETLELAHRTRTISEKELYHLAALGSNLGEMLEAAEKRGVEKYIESLNERKGGQIDGPGRRRPDADRSRNDLRTAVKVLNNLPG